MYLAPDFHSRSLSAHKAEIGPDQSPLYKPLEMEEQKCHSDKKIENGEEEMKMMEDFSLELIQVSKESSESGPSQADQKEAFEDLPR